MAHYVMGDIHGEADRFHAMLERIHLSEEDTLILLGDVIDRGPDGIALLLEIMEMPNVIMLLGNHEYMMLQYLSPDATGIEIRRWNKNGNAPTLAAYLDLVDRQVPGAHLAPGAVPYQECQYLGSYPQTYHRILL